MPHTSNPLMEMYAASPYVSSMEFYPTSVITKSL